MSEDRKYSPQCGAAHRNTVSSFYHKGRFRKIFRCSGGFRCLKERVNVHMCHRLRSSASAVSRCLLWDSLHITDTVNLLTPLRFLHFFAEKLRSSSESRSRRQCWILMILVPHGSTSKIYKAAGLAWEHNKWEDVITRGHFDSSDVTLLFRSTCTSVKAPLIQEPRLLSQTHTHTLTTCKTTKQGLRFIYTLMSTAWTAQERMERNTELHKVEAGRLDEVMKTRTSEFTDGWKQLSSIHFRLSQNFDVQLKIRRK